MYKTLCLALLLAASAAHALTAEESQTLRQAAITAGKQGDDATAFAHWQTLAEAGDAQAQYALFVYLYNGGDGVAQDSAQARAWLQKAAAQNNITAQYMLGVLYQRGEGGAQDHAKARAWLEKAAAQGSPEAQYRLGLIYESGIGVTPDDAQAAAWWEKAAAQGHPEAQYNLGIFYKQGRGVAQNTAKARVWLEKAAAQTRNEETRQAAQKALQNLNKTGGKKP